MLSLSKHEASSFDKLRMRILTILRELRVSA